MKKSDFESQMDRVIESFDDRNYNAERIKLIYNQVKDLTAHEFEKVCDELIGRYNYNQPPLVPQFREAYYAVRRQRFNSKVKATTQEIERSDLSEILKKMGYSSIMDAINKKK